MNYLSQIDMTAIFFLMGFIAKALKSDLKVPEGAGQFLSIYLLIAIGLKGGYQVQTAQSFAGFHLIFILGMVSCVLIPISYYHLFKKQVTSMNAAALGASFGSVSAVTFVTALGVLQATNQDYSGYMVAIMALMEIPAVIIALFFFQRDEKRTAGIGSLKGPLRGAFTNKSVILLVGGFLIGMVLNQNTWKSFEPFTIGIFKGMLGLFLLDLGMGAQEKFSQALKVKRVALLAGIGLPWFFGTLFTGLSKLAGLPVGDSFLIGVLVGSASYIAAPAAIKSVAPEANSALYIGIPLGLTFPINILIGIPYYLWLAETLF